MHCSQEAKARLTFSIPTDLLMCFLNSHGSLRTRENKEFKHLQVFATDMWDRTSGCKTNGASHGLDPSEEYPLTSTDGLSRDSSGPAPHDPPHQSLRGITFSLPLLSSSSSRSLTPQCIASRTLGKILHELVRQGRRILPEESSQSLVSRCSSFSLPPSENP